METQIRKLEAAEGMWYTKTDYSLFSKLIYLGKEEDENSYFQITDGKKIEIEAERALEAEKENPYDPTFEEGAVEVLDNNEII